MGTLRTCCALGLGILGAALGASGASAAAGDVRCVRYDGTSDDLLTAGLGASGLANPEAPTFADLSSPTAAELRRLAIHSNYRALVDMTPGGGYGRLYGPNVTAEGEATDGEGKIAGLECLTYTDVGESENVTLMVQVPDAFDPHDACIVTGASSGSRGVYGAIATSGEWGLKRGCAVAYTDKGTGTGAHALSSDTVNLIDGQRADAGGAGDASNFTAGFAYGSRDVFVRNTPYRFAFKHAHSQANPEKDWGLHVLEAIRFAFQVLNDEVTDGRRLGPNNTLVIASSISNGGGAAVKAAEQDHDGLIDGVAVGEPNVNPRYKRFGIRQGGGDVLYRHSRPLYDYATLLNLW